MSSAAPSLPAARVVALLCLAEVLSMTPIAAFPALLPILLTTWGLTNSQAGLISGAFFAGYMLAVPLLTSLTDRIDPRRVYSFATILSALGALGFALFTSGFWSALVLQALIGAGLAGTYMPGLKLLSDLISGPRQSRSVAFYTSTFGIGTSMSLWLAGAIASAVDWRWAFGLAAIGPLLAGVLVTGAFPATRPSAPAKRVWLLDFRPVFRNRDAMRYILAYGAHCWELFGFRSWIVAFFTYATGARSLAGLPLAGATTLAAGINLLGPGASIVGNELAVRFGRRRLAGAARAVSIVFACGVGFSAALPWYFMVAMLGLYFLVIMADSATLTAGVVAAARPDQRGVTIAVHSLFGFGAAVVAPAVFGTVLDVAGGNTRTLAWGLAFASLAVGYALRWLALTSSKKWLPTSEQL
jgi:MFS family permease